MEGISQKDKSGRKRADVLIDDYLMIKKENPRITNLDDLFNKIILKRESDKLHPMLKKAIKNLGSGGYRKALSIAQQITGRDWTSGNNIYVTTNSLTKSPKRTVTGASASGASGASASGAFASANTSTGRRLATSKTTKDLRTYLESRYATAVSNSSDEESTSPTKSFTHYWYNTWPDHGVPADIEQFKNFIKMLKDQIESDLTGGKTIIHCSAGVGRTGTVFVCLYLLMAVTGGEWHVIDEKAIVEAIKYARQFRMLQVQEQAQYIFICNCFGIEVSIETPLYKPIPKQLFPLVTYSITKDRYSNILPYVNNHITLTNGTYINASHAKIGQYQFILTQCPIRDTRRDTIPDFHNMIWEQKVSRIVMLTGIVEQGRPKCDDYLDLSIDRGIQFTLNDYKFNKLSTRQLDGYQERTYQMTRIDSSHA